jgi:DNA-binding NarL/FixJ family response regulator
MKKSEVREKKIRIAIVDGDPLRFVGFEACLSLEADFEIQSASLKEISILANIDVVLLASHAGTNAVELLSTFRAVRPDLPFIISGCNLTDRLILQAISAGAKGCVDEAGPVIELVRAIRMVHSGSVWAPRRVLAMFVEQAWESSGRGLSVGHKSLTAREKEVLKMLVEGCSNKEIAVPLGIEERTVKAHVAKLMRKVGVSNRVVLSVHALTHSLVRP